MYSIQTLVDAVKNFGKVIISTGYDNIATTINLLPGEGLRLPDPSVEGSYNLTWWNATDFMDPSDDPYREIVRVLTKVVDTLVIMRGQENTIVSNKNLSGKTYKMVLALTTKMISDLQLDAQTRANTTVENHRLTGIHVLQQPSQPIPNRSSFTAQIINAPTIGTYLPNISVPDGFAIAVRANIGNTGQIFIANSIANATSSAIPGNRITLNAGDATKLYVTNTNLIAVAGSATGNNVDILIEQ